MSVVQTSQALYENIMYIIVLAVLQYISTLVTCYVYNLMFANTKLMFSNLPSNYSCKNTVDLIK